MRNKRLDILRAVAILLVIGLLARLIEFPALRLRDRLFPSVSPAPTLGRTAHAVPAEEPASGRVVTRGIRVPTRAS